MSGQYGEPDWANPTASSAPASSESGDGGWTTSAAGEDFSSAVNTNPNTGGRNASGVSRLERENEFVFVSIDSILQYLYNESTERVG
eukprot:scaffold124_cov153-Skeletonema_menzelii.AAC.6